MQWYSFNLGNKPQKAMNSEQNKKLERLCYMHYILHKPRQCTKFISCVLHVQFFQDTTTVHYQYDPANKILRWTYSFALVANLRLQCLLAQHELPNTIYCISLTRPHVHYFFSVPSLYIPYFLEYRSGPLFSFNRIFTPASKWGWP